MNADIVGALEQLEKSWKAFEHKGKPMTKEQVREVLVYGIKKGYKTTAELSDQEVDVIIGSLATIYQMGQEYIKKVKKKKMKFQRLARCFKKL